LEFSRGHKRSLVRSAGLLCFQTNPNPIWDLAKLKTSFASKKHRLYAWLAHTIGSWKTHTWTQRKVWKVVGFFFYWTFLTKQKNGTTFLSPVWLNFNYLKLNSQCYRSNIAETYPDELPEYFTEIETLLPLEIAFKASTCNSEISFPSPSNDPFNPETTIE